jgi:ElaB/YqjD/DUF883 family membrane-anchored ribosome-binding protein
MDNQQSDKSSEKISKSIEKINEWLEETDDWLEYDQRSYKSSEETSNLIAKIDQLLKNNKWLGEETNKTPEYSIKKLEDLFHKMVKNIEEIVNLQGMATIFRIKKAYIFADVYCKKLDNIPMWCEYRIKAILYNKNYVGDSLECYSDSKLSPYKIQCTYSNVGLYRSIYKTFELPDSIYFIRDIKKKIPKIHKELYPEVFENLDKQYIHMRAVDYMNLDNPENKNPETYKYKVIRGTSEYYVYKYKDNKHIIEMILSFDPSVESYNEL